MWTRCVLYVFSGVFAVVSFVDAKEFNNLEEPTRCTRNNDCPDDECCMRDDVNDGRGFCRSFGMANQTCMTTVNHPPEIVFQPGREIYFKPQDPLQLPCEATGFPEPTYKWTLNGENFDIHKDDDTVAQLPHSGTIVFNSLDSKDAGIYQCFASNHLGVSASDKIKLLEARLEAFPPEDSQAHEILYEMLCLLFMVHRVHVDDALTLPCFPPMSSPQASVYWVVINPGGRLEPVFGTKRITMDLQGMLRITRTEKSDEREGKAYACIAVNYVLRDFVRGPEHFIEVIGTSQHTSPAAMYWSSPTDVLAFKGQSLRLMCIFAGNPTPDVIWHRDDGTKVLPARAKIRSFGRVLEINNTQEEDAGQYECSGSNDVSMQRTVKSFFVRIHSAPYWIDKPKNVDARPGENATFYCHAGGDPTPTYEWSINGVPLRGMS